jgi:hypothetical protein
MKRPILTISLALFVIAGCATTRAVYYDTWEKLGYAKRDRLINDIKAATGQQQQAKKQFASALDEFKSVVHFNGGNLEAQYDKLNKQYKECSDQADAVRNKIAAVKHVAEALFDEWHGEIKEMGDDPQLRVKSQQLYDETHDSYGELIKRMDAASATMDPVLTHFHNRVLFLKANLNAEAIASLQGTEQELGGDIDNLVKQMDASIAEADDFIGKVQQAK